MTPALRLNEHDKKPLLSCILKFLLLGKSLIIKSMHMKDAPKTQAEWRLAIGIDSRRVSSSTDRVR